MSNFEVESGETCMSENTTLPQRFSGGWFTGVVNTMSWTSDTTPTGNIVGSAYTQLSALFGVTD